MWYDRKSGNWLKYIPLLTVGFVVLWYVRRSPNRYSNTECNIFTFNHGEWTPNKTVCQPHILESLKTKDYFRKGSLITDIGQGKREIDIYINNPKEDLVISKDIHEKKTYDPWIFNTIYKHIRHDPSIAVIDVGANIGSNTLPLAGHGRTVFAIEPTYQCVRHLCASILDNGGMNGNIFIIHNAVSFNHDDVPFVLPSKGEFGLSFVELGESNNAQGFSKLYSKSTYRKEKVPIKATTLNDLLTFPGFNKVPKVFIKIDIQGFEPNVIKGADKLFSTGKVVGVLIEWTWQYNRTGGDYLMKKFSDWNLEPFYCDEVLVSVSADLGKPCVKLDTKRSSTWKTLDNIVWLHKKI